MESLLKILGVVFGAVALIALASFVGGTIVWLIWPHVIPVVLPGLVASGSIAGIIGWWKAVLLSWLVGSLFKSTSTSSSK